MPIVKAELNITTRPIIEKVFFSLARWKSVFLTECETKEQIDRYGDRLAASAISLFGALCGFSLSAFTAGAASPAVVAVFGSLGGGYQAAGLHSFLKLFDQDSIVKGFDTETFERSHMVGFVTGLVTGGLSVGITAGITGIGALAIPKARVTSKQLVGKCVAVGVTEGIVSSLADDAEKIFFDGLTMTWNEVVRHAVTGVVQTVFQKTARAFAGIPLKKTDESVSKNFEK